MEDQVESVNDGVSRFMNKLIEAKSINTVRATKVLLLGLEGLFRWILKSPKTKIIPQQVIR